ncbi:phBC6A51 family helix-turn-helix protein [Clostridium sp. Mt-5]|uniref:PhBC6A51 family helix-turn-helix protein n=1 Tax=Clostridium moutaii TaxID=3240932 RepID=A0ABV4BSI3_9CLOT
MLSKKQLKCIKLMVESEFNQKQISEEIKVSEQTICKWKQNEEFKVEYDKHVKESVDYTSKDAARTMKKLLKARSEIVRFYAAKDILDRTGLKPVDKVEHSGNVAVNNPYKDLTTEELKKLAALDDKDG